MVAGTVPATVVDKTTGKSYSTDKAAGKQWYVLKPGISYTPYRYYTNWNSDRNNVYYGLDFRFIKRLSNRWMLSGSFSLQNQVQHYGEKGYADPTNIWALEGQIYAPSLGGGSGKLSQPAFSRWLVKIDGFINFPSGLMFPLLFLAGRDSSCQRQLLLLTTGCLTLSAAATLFTFGLMAQAKDFPICGMPTSE
jgi:hypothetical protein